MKKVSHKIIILLIMSVVFSSLGGAWFALKGFIKNKENELLEKNSQVVMAVLNLTQITKSIDSPELVHAISSFPLFGVGIVDTSSEKVILSNGGLTLNKNHWKDIQEKKSSASVTSVTLESIFLSLAYLDEGSLAVVATTPRTSVWHLVKEVFSSYLILLFILTVIVGIIGALIARAMVKPIEDLTKAADQMAQGKWEMTPLPKRNDEIGVLAQTFYRMSISLKDRENTIREMNEELALSEKLAMIGQFSSGISHEIKNPLASMSTHIQLLKRLATNPTEDLPSKVSEKSDIILKEVERANRIITDILGFSRQDKLKLIPTQLKDYLEVLKHELLPIAESRNANIKLEWEGLDTEIEIDHDKIRQVFTNLLSNSLDAFADKKGVIFWKVKVRNEIIIEVQDNGPGIPFEFRKKLFDPFFTSKPAGKGTGLGLSVCHGIIKQHSGSLSCLPSNTGASFQIVLPLGKKSIHAAEVESI